MNIQAHGTTQPFEADAATAPRPSGANVIVLSGDSALVSLLRDSLAGSHRVWRADDATHAADLIVAAGNAALLIDASLANHDTRGLVSAIHEQFPDLAIIVAGRRDDEAELAPLVSQGAIFRFLHKPASAERIRNFVDATQRGEPQGTNRPAAAPRPTLVQALRPYLQKIRLPAVRVDRARLRRYFRRSLLLLPLLALLAWHPWRDVGGLSPEPAQAPAAPLDPGQHPAVLRLLDAAAVAFSQDRLIEPPGRNAFGFYRAVLDRNPGNPIATQGMQQIADQLLIDAGQALADRDLAALAGAIDAVRSVQPGHPRLPYFTTQLARERTRRAAAAPTPSVANRNAGQATDVSAIRSDADRVQSFVQLANQRMASGHLVGDADSAQVYLFAGRRLAPTDPGVRQGFRMLGTLLENNARHELAAGRLDAATAWFHEAIALDHDRDALERLRADLQAARFGSLREYQPLPAADAPLAAAPELTVIAESRLQRRRFQPPLYPEPALSQRIEGWVDIEFTVARDGTTREPRVVAAAPPGVFEDAALDALARWRYEPMTIDGAPVDQRVATRLRFELTD